MTLFRLVIRSLCYYWRTGAVVVFGLAVATAVIVGSLVVGDSVKGSITDTATARLGRIDNALIARRFFHAELASDLQHAASLAGKVKQVVPLTILRGAAESVTTEAVLPKVAVNGVDDSFWTLFPGCLGFHLTGRETAVNSSLARELGVGVGDSILVNVDKEGAVPSGTLFAHKSSEETLSSLRLDVVRVLDDHGVGGFRLDAGADTLRSVFVSREWLMSEIGKDGMANVLVTEPVRDTGEDTVPELQAALKPLCTIGDFGLKVVPNVPQNCVSLESIGMLLDGRQVIAGEDAARKCGARSALTSVYLATKIQNLDHPGASLAYSVVAAVQPLAPFPIRPGGSSLLDNGGIWLNTWAAEDLKARVGDRIELAYLVPRPDGAYRDAELHLTLRGIVDMVGPANDRNLVPAFEGITQAESIDDWNPPFPVDLSLVTERDETYWKLHKTTPKAFVSLNTMRGIWMSTSSGRHAGWVTSVRVAAGSGRTTTVLSKRFGHTLIQSLSAEDEGMLFRPIRRQVIASSAGTTDFGQLFMAMSFFLVVSGAGLAAMLMRLSVEQRGAESGVMLACGFRQASVSLVIFCQGTLLAILGVVAGVPLGVLYASGVIAGLRTRWIDAVGTTSVWLHISTESLVIGAFFGLLVGMISMWWSVRQLRKTNALRLLSGWRALGVLISKKADGRNKLALAACMLTAVGMMASSLSGSSPQMGFFGGGAALLAAGLVGSNMLLIRAMQIRMSLPTLGGMALRSAAANRSRSLLVIALLASAAFITIAVAANTRDYSRTDYGRRDSGTGGFALRAVSALPIHYDLGSPKGRENLGFSRDDEKAFEGVRVVSFLMSPGDDISCLNLAKPQYPRVIAVNRQMMERGGFDITTMKPSPNPWTLLQAGAGRAIPVFGDSSSVVWNLHSGLGKTYNTLGADGKPVAMRFVGLLSQSIFASELLMSEDRFRQVFSGVDDPRYFLFEVPNGREQSVALVLRRNLGRMGLEVKTTAEVLNSYIGVQNAYLSMFLAIGGLGVMLGTVGLVAVLLRSALERRREFALMLAQGFSRKSIFKMLVIENVGLLVFGVLLGTLSALVAVAPELAGADSQMNWGAVAAVFVGVLVVGFASCIGAASKVAGGPLIEVLRGE